jgi:hypothetical protein
MQHQKIEKIKIQNLGENILNIWHQNVEPATTACIIFLPWKLAHQKSMTNIADLECDVSQHLILQKKALPLDNNTNTYFILCF